MNTRAPLPPAKEVELLQTLKLLLTHERQEPPHHSAPAGEVMGVLSYLQEQALTAAPGNTPPLLDGDRIRQAIATRTPGGAPLGQVDNTIIDVVCMLFDFILEDKSIPDPAKALIGRLQIPYLKVALVDKTFLSRKNHPARELLNELAHAGLGLNEPQGRDSLLATMERIVHRILNDFEADVALFEALNAELADYLEESHTHEAAALEATLREHEAREAETRAASEIRRTLHERILVLDFPDTIAAWLHEEWAEVMLHAHRHEDGEETSWQRHLAFLDTLSWTLTPKQDPSEKRQLAAAIPQLLMTLRHAMTEAGRPAERIEQAIQSLEPFHLASFDETPPATEPAAAELPPVAEMPPAEDENELSQLVNAMEENLEALNALEALFDEEESTDSAPPPAHALAMDDDIDAMEATLPGDCSAPKTGPDDEHLATARTLEMGVWVQFTGENGRTRRGKLVWKSDLLGEFTFVSWRHQVIAEKTLHGLAADFRHGNAAVVKNAPVLDRAMEAVLGGLRSRLERAPATD